MGAPSSMLQLVDYAENFSSKLPAFLASNNVLQREFDYHTVAVIGCQSSGKSTLLNMLFGTSFPTMESERGRYQVTQGVWLGVDAHAGRGGGGESPTVVLDLEGTDSRERGEEAVRFERKSALFALALAEVLVVNMWVQDVGRYNAANMALLRTVLEQDLQLFERYSADSEHRKRTRLLFVLRDHVSTPLPMLERTLADDLRQAWDSLSKPAELADSRIGDFFDVDYVSLAHKELRPDDFARGIGALRGRFRDGSLYRDEYRRGIAADGFSTFCEQVWQVIRENRELDIPTQKEMLSHVRCEELARESEAMFSEQCSDGGEDAADGGRLAAAYERAVSHYVTHAARYVGDIAAARGDELRKTLALQSKDAFMRRLAPLLEAQLERFAADMDEAVAGADREPWRDFGERLRAARTRAEDAVRGASRVPAAFASLPSWTDDVRAQRRQFERSLARTTAKARERVLAAARTAAAEQFRQAAEETLFEVFESAVPASPLSSAEQQQQRAQDEMWPRVQLVIDEHRRASMASLREMYASVTAGAEDNDDDEEEEDDEQQQQEQQELMRAHDQDTHEAVLRLVRAHCEPPSAFLWRMVKRFNDAFRFDAAHGHVPRVWQPHDNIQSVFLGAKQCGTALLAAFRVAKFDDATHVVFSASQAKELEEKFEQQVAAAYVEAVRAREAASVRTRVPPWVLMLMVVLGWNELVAVLRNPVLLAAVLVMLPVAAALWYAGVGDQAWWWARVAAQRALAAVVHALHEAGAPGAWDRVAVPPPRYASAAASAAPRRRSSGGGREENIKSE